MEGGHTANTCHHVIMSTLFVGSNSLTQHNNIVLIKLDMYEEKLIINCCLGSYFWWIVFSCFNIILQNFSTIKNMVNLKCRGWRPTDGRARVWEAHLHSCLDRKQSGCWLLVQFNQCKTVHVFAPVQLFPEILFNNHCENFRFVNAFHCWQFNQFSWSSKSFPP